MRLALTTIPHANFAQDFTRDFNYGALKYREGHDQRCRRGTAARESRICTTNDTVSTVTREQNA